MIAAGPVMARLRPHKSCSDRLPFKSRLLPLSHAALAEDIKPAIDKEAFQ
jgi:hypothetical protein